MLHITLSQAIWLLVPALPFGIWIAWSDLKYMKITNRAVLLLTGCFLIVGAIALPFEQFLWHLAQIAVVLVIGIVLNAGGLVGGGDAKYAAVMAGFFHLSDWRIVLLLFGCMLLAAFVTHRIAGRIPAIRRLTPEWKSWTVGKDFPMGLALSGTLIGYLALAVYTAA
jgi:prepilin peptidase CpaA